jgi:ribosomal protein L37AE/L43A
MAGPVPVSKESRMARCDVCGNDYAHPMVIRVGVNIYCCASCARHAGVATTSA